MNVERDGGGFIVFRDSWPEEQPVSAPPADGAWADHLRARELAERAAAKNATCARAREVHQQLAQAYSRIIRREGGE
jgi:hypothetical protein